MQTGRRHSNEGNSSMDNSNPQNSPQTSENVPAEVATREVCAQPPEEFAGLRKTTMQKAAVGVASVVSAMTHV